MSPAAAQATTTFPARLDLLLVHDQVARRVHRRIRLPTPAIDVDPQANFSQSSGNYQNALRAGVAVSGTEASAMTPRLQRYTAMKRFGNSLTACCAIILACASVALEARHQALNLNAD